MSKKGFEIEVLNFEDLDVEELEKRLEMAAMGSITPDSWICFSNNSECGVDNCNTYVCVSDQCSGFCASDSCTTLNTCDTLGCGGKIQIP